MSVSEELDRLSGLHSSGKLSDEEFSRAKARVLSGETEPPIAAAVHRFARSRNDRWIGGVCGGLAHVTGMPSWVCRLLFTMCTLFVGTGLLAYLLLWIFVPEE